MQLLTGILRLTVARIGGHRLHPRQPAGHQPDQNQFTSHVAEWAPGAVPALLPELAPVVGHSRGAGAAGVGKIAEAKGLAGAVLLLDAADHRW